MKKLKIVTLNLWRYYDWPDRRRNVLEFIAKNNPDIIALQEVQLNKSFSELSQAEDIAKSAGYKYHVFSPTMKKTDQIDLNGDFTQEAEHGLAIISKYPITSSESYLLQKHPQDKEKRTVLFCDIQIQDTILRLCNVHFSNRTIYSDLHIKELMDVIKGKKHKPIILGDFNIYDLSPYKLNILDGYKSSRDFSSYTSYPKDDGSLDYVLLPDSYSFEKISCPAIYLSDHRPVVAEIISDI